MRKDIWIWKVSLTVFAVSIPAWFVYVLKGEELAKHGYIGAMIVSYHVLVGWLAFISFVVVMGFLLEAIQHRSRER